jgi:hypothetical protein
MAPERKPQQRKVHDYTFPEGIKGQFPRPTHIKILSEIPFGNGLQYEQLSAAIGINPITLRPYIGEIRTSLRKQHLPIVLKGNDLTQTPYSLEFRPEILPQPEFSYCDALILDTLLTRLPKQDVEMLTGLGFRRISTELLGQLARKYEEVGTTKELTTPVETLRTRAYHNLEAVVISQFRPILLDKIEQPLKDFVIEFTSGFDPQNQESLTKGLAELKAIIDSLQPSSQTAQKKLTKKSKTPKN